MTPTSTTLNEEWDQFQNAQFSVGGEDQLAELRERYATRPDAGDEEGARRFERDWQRFLTDLRIRIGTLLKTDSVSLLLGAGVSKDCGGLLMGSIPVQIERDLLGLGVTGTTASEVQPWLLAAYAAIAASSVEHAGEAVQWPTPTSILERRNAVNELDPVAIKANFETALSLLHRWRFSLARDLQELTLTGSAALTLRAPDITAAIRHCTTTLAKRCELPTPDAVVANSRAPQAFNLLLRKVLTRPLNLRRASIFTLNYDTLLEQAADAEGVVLLDGFVGSLRRVFRPESFDQDLYYPGETTEGRVHRRDRVLHLYKLHGSLNWAADAPTWENPFGVTSWPTPQTEGGRALIFPTPAKYGETLGLPYSELFRRFAGAVVRPQSTLFVLGYSFGDDHVTAILRQALATSSFTLVIVDPTPSSSMVNTLIQQADRRVWVLSGTSLGCFAPFVEHALPDLRDEDIQRRVIETVNSLRPSADSGGRPSNA